MTILFSQLLEELNSEEKKEVDTWEKGDNSFSDHLFNHKDDHSIVLPLKHPEQEGHKDEINYHLEPHGYSIKDYKSGTAIDKHGRETRIGKALNATKAPEDLKNKFQNDPSRSHKETGSDDLRVTITRHPHHVAGMTSGGHCWENESCMRFSRLHDDTKDEYEKKLTKDALQSDLKHGTHVAYLHHKDDHELKHPLARIALKKFSNESGTEHILRPEERTYGPESDAFRHTVHSHLEKHMPVNESEVYKKHENVYDDDRHNVRIGNSKKALRRYIDKLGEKGHSESSRKIILNHPEFDDKTADQLHEKGYGYVMESPRLSKEYLGKQVDRVTNYEMPHDPLIHNPKLTPAHIHKLLDHGVQMHPDSPALKPEHIKRIIDKDERGGRETSDYIQHPNASYDNVKHFMDTHPGYRSNAIRFNSKLKGDHLHKLVKDGYADEGGPVAKAILYHKNVQPKTVDHLLNHPEARKSIIGDNISSLDSQNPDVIRTMWKHQKEHNKNDDSRLKILKIGYRNKKGLPDDIKDEVHS